MAQNYFSAEARKHIPCHNGSSKACTSDNNGRRIQWTDTHTMKTEWHYIKHKHQQQQYENIQTATSNKPPINYHLMSGSTPIPRSTLSIIRLIPCYHNLRVIIICDQCTAEIPAQSTHIPEPSHSRKYHTIVTDSPSKQNISSISHLH